MSKDNNKNAGPKSSKADESNTPRKKKSTQHDNKKENKGTNESNKPRVNKSKSKENLEKSNHSDEKKLTTKLDKSEKSPRKPRSKLKESPSKVKTEKNGNTIKPKVDQLDADVDGNKIIESPGRKKEALVATPKEKKPKTKVSNEVKDPKPINPSKHELKKEDVKKQEALISKEEPIKKAKDWGRAGNDPRNK